MHGIQHDGVGEHEDGFEDVEVCFVGVSAKRGQYAVSLDLELDVEKSQLHLQFSRPTLETLHNPINTAHRNQRRRSIHDSNDSAQIPSHETLPPSPRVPDSQNSDMSPKSASLQYQRSLDQDLTSLPLSSPSRSVHSLSSSISNHKLDKEIHPDESRQDLSRVQRREPGDVVEGTG